ncbi:MAG: Flp pilus assembly protein CpaB [Methylovirgula sp.]
MKPARLVILGIAALAGVGAFLLILSGSKPPESVKVAAPAAPPPMDQVLVADQDIPFGNTIESGDLRWLSWPKNKAPAGAILQSKDPDATTEFEGWLVRSRLGQGEPVYRDRIIQPGKSGFLAALLPEGMRAVAIGIDSQGATTAGNFILPGDHVDVIHTYRDNDVARANGGDGMVSETILHNVRILAIGENIQKAGKEPVVGGSNATLELTPKQVEQVILAQKVGQLSLSLRSMVDSDATESSDSSDKDTNFTIVRYGVPVPGRAH